LQTLRVSQLIVPYKFPSLSVTGRLRDIMKQRKASPRKRGILSCLAILLLSLAILWHTRILTADGASFYSPRPVRLHLIVVSDSVSNFENNSWMLELTIVSFLKAFSLPDHRVWVEASVYLSCGQEYETKPTKLGDAFVEDALEGYVLEVRRVVEKYRENFRATNFMCSGVLSSSMCDANLKQAHHDVVFFLEHDWIILPSQVQVSAFDLGMKVITNRNIEYVLLQRGDRENKAIKLSELPDIYRSKLYSNNPFFASQRFLTKMMRDSKLCDDNTNGITWERNAEKFCKETGCKLALLLPPRNRSGISVYHMDGRLLTFAKDFSEGPLFGNRGLLVPLISAKHIHPSSVVDSIDAYCHDQPEYCEPYYLRNAFVRVLKAHALKQKCVKETSLLELSSAYFGPEASATFVSGHFPLAGMLEELLAAKACEEGYRAIE